MWEHAVADGEAMLTVRPFADAPDRDALTAAAARYGPLLGAGMVRVAVTG
ncbi:hypothetical protein I4I73_09485 [Pseudonocardia sp. KRD-184]|uniref:Uncharacterized protein n=1 Tax=Pseudonocardia oceani TaxID=2792013 RepID=A0ABS6UHY8_9PSEU|nr:hypothetical protein [Pseudonocardia oceani]MBW0091443.1 hypothetical protein [Pseudonocardia oceani]MBW0096219.1 hypothetical protein [Pseudonocardia oceani]MBW0111084.1 hypothetical protein [Pseudonocardia oceani]MBW0120111.1 hypothetical protein [Pseudonocardia oceani]MBW0131531.1 hypothetical protein [Pseudonocardia oceani]